MSHQQRVIDHAHAVEILDATISLYKDWGWCRGTNTKVIDGKVHACMNHAISIAAWSHPIDTTNTIVNDTRIRRFRIVKEAVMEAAWRLYPEPYLDEHVSVPYINDRLTSKRQVLRILVEARRMLDSQEVIE